METETAVPATEGRVMDRGWSALASVAAIVLIAVFVFIQAAIAKAVIPPLAVFIVLLIAAAVVARSRPRAGTIAIGVLALLSVVGNLAPIIDDVSDPQSTVTFIATFVALVAALTAVVSAVSAIARSAAQLARPLAIAGGALVITGVVLGVAAGASSPDAKLASGDVEVVAKDVKFAPEEIRVNAGDASFYVDNRDLTRHTFTIAELDIDEEMTANKAVRVELDDVKPGTYDITCEVLHHEDMTAVLVVE
jgi:plastocyanin